MGEKEAEEEEHGGERCWKWKVKMMDLLWFLTKSQSFAYPSLGLSCTTFYTFCPQSRISLLDSLLCLALG